MTDSIKSKLGALRSNRLLMIIALSSISAILTTANKAAAVPMYPNDFGNSTQIVRLQMEKTAPNGQPVTINITRAYGLKNGGLLNTWTGTPDDESLYNYITNGSAVNFQSRNGNYSINVPTLEIRDGTRLNTYASEFVRYQDWNIEKLGGQYGDTYLFHWRTDTNTNLCLDIRGFAPGQKLVNEVPGLSYCDGNNANQRIRVIKQTQGLVPAVTRPPNSLINNTTMPQGTSINSTNQCFRLDAQSDGNLVLYRKSNGQALWATGTDRRNVNKTIFQNDGNLVIYNTSNQAVWASGTDRRGGTRLTVQDDGNFVMYNAQNQALWQTNTVTSCNATSPVQPNPDIKINLYFQGGFTTAQQNSILKAAQNWESIITRDMVSSGVLNVSVVAGEMSLSGNHWAETSFDIPKGQIAPPRQRRILSSPYHATMTIRRSFLSGSNSWELTKLATHELGHALYLDEATLDGKLAEVLNDTNNW